ncbi:glucose dehydrogenase [FAD, quinone]-like [Frankliniella occidentalis]|uniref:Glucose dehydrogenase [FAD, quinone]-like n=1 Tax=Frankliniella occidentalis TaxID=133901 RepID=A0A9C6WZZ4_FRAOC|nr:glucose dehydrogenase [FAD, quinone]-like [Frankliniella occidentalis]
MGDKKKEEVDFVVVGGGTAGAVVAARLSERPDFNVVLLEAGGCEPAFAQVPSFYISDGDVRRLLDWDFKLEPQAEACLGHEDGVCHWPRGKVLGGTSTINGMMYMRGNRWDYDRWEAEGLAGWGWRHVLPYFKKSEDNAELGQKHVDDEYHSRGGYLTVQRFPDQPPLAWDILAGAAELGFRTNVDLNGRNQTGFTVAQANVRDGRRLSLSRAFLHPARDRPNLRVITNAMVVRVSMDGDRARGVVFHRDGALHKLRVRREVVLAAGAIQTPHLLLLSGVGPRRHLEDVGVRVVADCPGVGGNLQNHISFSVDFAVESITPGSNRLDMPAFEQFLSNGTGAMASTGLSQLTGFVHSRFSDGVASGLPDLQVFFEGCIANCSITGLPGEPSHQGGPMPFRMIPVVLRPKSRGEVRLRSRDPTAPPKLTANYLQDRYDVDLLIDGVRFVQRLANTSALRQHGVALVMPETPGGCSELEPDSDAYWECLIRHRTNPENHQCGSARMGPDGDPGAVLDARLQVRGVRGLRVADAAAIPHVVSANLNAAVVMVAERAADFIKQDYPAWGLDRRRPTGSPTGRGRGSLLDSLLSLARSTGDSR